MPALTIRDWIRSMGVGRDFTIVSDPTLVTKLSTLQRERADGLRKLKKPVPLTKAPTTVPRFGTPNPFVLHATPAELLLSVGRATTPLVPNLTALSSLWAYRRYIWAFEPNQTSLILTATARELDFHQKTVLSDEMGVGVAYWIMKQHFGAVGHIDVAVAAGSSAVANAQGFPAVTIGKRSPDYLFDLGGGQFCVVECKGSQSRLATTMGQLVSGLEQVTSVKVAGKAIDSYVVATLLECSRTQVFIVDPPGEGPDGEEPPSEDERKPVRRTLDVKDAEALARSIERLDAAKLLAFAGDESGALELAGIEGSTSISRGTFRSPDLEVVEVGNRDERVEARGRRLASFVPGQADGAGVLDVFQGVEQEMYDQIREDGRLRRDAEAREGVSARTPRQPFRTLMDEASGSVTAIADDGAVLSFTPRG